MAYTDEHVLAKLSALNETQESVVTASQWIMFHRRHADRTAQLWLTRLKDASPNKRLNLIYLANEVAQQSKARNKDNFLIAFSPVIADATAIAYKGATNDVQQKLRRVIEVWRQRQIFELPIQEAIESRVDEIDKTRSSGRRPLLGGSMLSSSSGAAPPEIQPLIPLQTAINKLSPNKATAVARASEDHEKLTNPASAPLTPPVHAARLSGLLKALASASSAVAESVKARKEFIAVLEELIASNRGLLSTDETKLAELDAQKIAIEAKKREVEDGIMRGLADEGETNITPQLAEMKSRASSERSESQPTRTWTPTEILNAIMDQEPKSPEVEPITPVNSPPPMDYEPPSANTNLPTGLPTGADATSQPPPPKPLAGIPSIAANGSDLLSSLSLPHVRPLEHSPPHPTNGSPAVKRRRVDEVDEYAALGGPDAMDGLDADVAEMLRQQGAGGGS
ncbi:MAG: hypothetical protein M1825_004343 [Sarcosagium campestre]|nr:MAG: hypothetical protein M1825_004343 [Sarcosagium campestre]